MDHLVSPIEPTIGRIVYVRDSWNLSGDKPREYPAIITWVRDRNSIDVEIFGRMDHLRIRTGVQYDSDPSVVMSQAVWRWMPYQVQQAMGQAPATGAAREAGDAPSAQAKQETFIDRLKAEIVELEIRLSKLKAFIDSRQYVALSKRAAHLFLAQQFHMEGYLQILRQRLDLIELELRN